MNSIEFARRRQRLMGMMGEGAVALLPAASESVRNRDIHFPYRQDSDFYYLTGFSEPEAVAVLAPGREHGEYLLFCRERDPEREVWDGKRAGQEGAIEAYGADDSFPIDTLDDIVPGILEKCDRVFYTMGANPEFDDHVFGWVNGLRHKSRAGARVPKEFVALEHLLHDMRLYKSAVEIETMDTAVAVSVEAHERAIRRCRPGMTEFQIEAEYLHTFRSHGAVPSYPPIVAGGANACILHYVENKDTLRDGDLLLIDAGAEYGLYAADITRTFPVNGKFSGPQRAIYELVLAAQAAAIHKVRPGNHWDEPHAAAVRVLTEGLVDLGLLKGEVDKLIEEKTYRKYYMHRSGHWLGLDVHDVGAYKVNEQWRTLEPGMVLTVEPGLYLAETTKGVKKRFHNIGVRIEDDVLVTADGCRVLSAALPKAVDAIEAMMHG
jgi:Xaa-Pro aminopeptidase